MLACYLADGTRSGRSYRTSCALTSTGKTGQPDPRAKRRGIPSPPPEDALGRVAVVASAMSRRRARATGPSWGAGSMERRRLADIIAFDPRRMAKHRVFETDRTITDLYCLDPDQQQLLLVRVEAETAEIGQYEAVLVPAGAKHALKNLGPDPAVLLVFLAPRLA